MNSRSNQWQQLSESAIRRLQADKLQDFLRLVVLPFSAHYQKVFREQGLNAGSIRSVEDLARLPFTAKTDLLSTPEKPQRFRDFVIVPDQAVLTRRPGTVLRALLRSF